MQTVDVTRHVIGLLVLLAILITVVVILLPKVKVKFPDLKWLSGWVNSKMLITFAIGIIATLTAREFLRQEWNRFFTDHGWYAWLVLIAGNFLFCLLFGRKAETSGTTPSHGGHGGEGSSKGSGFAAFLLVALLVGLVSLVVRGNLNDKGQVGQSRPTGTALSRSDAYPIAVNVWTPVVIGERIDAIWHAPKGYFFRYNSELMEYEDEPNISIKMPTRRGPYTVHFRAKEVPTVVSVYQTIP